MMLAWTRARWPELAVALVWIAIGLGMVHVHEASIQAFDPPILAAATQVAWNWVHGDGWTQTATLWADSWAFGDHCRVQLGPLAVLAAGVPGPWALARLQVILVGLGILPAAALGRAEGGRFGLAVALLLYAGSATTAFLALTDYVDLVLAIPAIMLLVTAARHAPERAFIAACIAAGCVREELWPLLPLLAWSGGRRRAAIAGGVALLFAAAVFLYPGPSPCGRAASLDAVRAVLSGGASPVPAHLDVEALLRAFGPSAVSVLAAPGYALLAVAFVAFLDQPFLAEHFANGFGTPHHYAPVAGIGIVGGVLGACALARRWPFLRAPLLAAIGIAAMATGWQWREDFYGHALRPPWTEHPAWALLEQVPDDAVLFTPRSIAPAAARRRWLLTPESLGPRSAEHPAAFAIVPADRGVGGVLIATDGAWKLIGQPDPVLLAGVR